MAAQSKFFWDQLNLILSSCLRCGIFWNAQIYCPACWDFLYRDFSPGSVQLAKGISVRYSFLWQLGNFNLREFIYFLKGGFNYRVIKKFMEDLVVKDPYLINYISQPVLFIPSPAKVTGYKDHAYHLAQALAEITNKPILNLFVRNQFEREQKELSKPNRLKRTLSLDQKALKMALSQHANAIWVFVDDVVTTGATAQAAQEALKKRKKLEVYALCYRERLLKN